MGDRFRFLTPVPVSTCEPQLSNVARQAGANPITLPSENPSSVPSIAGEVSPTGVADLVTHPSWKEAKDAPSWYAKGADVDALLDVADTLDWLADTGDLNETYKPTPEDEEDEAAAAAAAAAAALHAEDSATVDPHGPHHPREGEEDPGDMDPPSPGLHHDHEDPQTAAGAVSSSSSSVPALSSAMASSIAAHNSSVTSLPRVDSNNMESVVPALPSLFDHGPPMGEERGSEEEEKERENAGTDGATNVTLKKSLPSAASTLDPHLNVSESTMDLQVFDTAMEEHDFVSTILQEDEENNDGGGKDGGAGKGEAVAEAKEIGETIAPPPANADGENAGATDASLPVLG